MNKVTVVVGKLEPVTATDDPNPDEWQRKWAVDKVGGGSYRQQLLLQGIQ